ncbi:LysR family transcriptional regulator [Caballeronia sp. AZ7_KS35]|uniref:LysR family transcriptional regulator n=1 Tax=Caballeronia sp. AZ7_KS35 TaxID=2921762 RepID=UPI002029520B|nr:LysR family transcriptional regulator [Caballeronia sp. AZ7_KS35]
MELEAMSVFQLNLRHLYALMAIDEHRSISAAATAVGLSQPALTQGILKLESQLGLELFERRSNGIVPTSAGTLMLERIAASMGHLSAGCRLVTGADFAPERRLTMTQLRAFLALAKTRSFAAAANELGSSQPAVHRAMRELEEALDRKLVERRTRGVHVTFHGDRFARSCWLAIRELKAALSELGLDPQNPVLLIGTTPLARAFLVPEVMSMMVAEQFSANFRVLEGSWADLVESLRDGEIDLIVGEQPETSMADLKCTALYTEAPVVVAGHQHELAGKRNPSHQTLASYPWIISPEASPLRTEWEELFARNRPQTPVECGSIMIIGRMLSSSNMLTLALPDQVALQIRSGLLARIGEPLAASAVTIGVTTRQSWRLTGAQRRFLDLLRQVSHDLGVPTRRKSMIESTWN